MASRHRPGQREGIAPGDGEGQAGAGPGRGEGSPGIRVRSDGAITVGDDAIVFKVDDDDDLQIEVNQDAIGGSVGEALAEAIKRTIGEGGDTGYKLWESQGSEAEQELSELDDDDDDD